MFNVFGNMADMEKIMDIAKKYNLKVLEDATEALGTYYTEGKYKGKFAGTMGDFRSFYHSMQIKLSLLVEEEWL